MKLSIIIVNYNVRFFLEQCLHTVQKALTSIEGEVLVVDNASEDGSRSYLEPLFPNVNFIWNSTNVGFAKANNQALQVAKGEFILFLNPDTIVPEDCFEKCLQFFDANPDAGAIGVRMLDGKGAFLPESKRSFPSPLTSFFKLSGLSALFPHSKIFGKYHLGHLDEHKNHEVNVLAGAFMLVRREVLEKTGGFDEQFFMYGEDVDLSYRIQNSIHPSTGKNYKNYYFSETSILHFKGESTKKGSLNYVRMFYLAMSQFVEKHYSTSRAGIFSLIIRGAIWIRALMSMLKQLIKKAGLPVLDGILIWLMFLVAKEIWVEYVRKDINYQSTLIYASFTGFSLLFLAVSYYTGLYQKKFRFSDLWKSGISMLLILLAVYSLLPENIRFSRGIVLFGSLMSLCTLGIWRKILLYFDILEPTSTDEEIYTLIVGSHQDAQKVYTLTQQSKKTSPVKGIVSPLKEENSLGTTDELLQIVRGTPVRELIFCESNQLSFKEIIQYYQRVPDYVKLRIHAHESHSIIGSDSKFYSGETIGGQNYRLSMPVYRRLKRLADVIVSVLLMMISPLHFFINRHPLGILKNILMVIVGKKTWVGYFESDSKDLPELPKAILGPSGIPVSNNKLNAEACKKSNEWYAQEYEILTDISTIFRHYKYLGVS